MSDSILDAKGLICPEPVMMLHQSIRRLEVGQTVTVWATDPSTQRDIPNFCHYLGHELVSQDQQEDTYCYIIKKQ